ncbi:MAG: A/G-specific adenine glycosylase [Chitinophagaceae bacterium]|nr:A/G-specific adenine glycosylase [Chitinophagaceae bacterium]
MHKLPIEDKLTDQQFVEGLLQWNKESNKRQMPWKGERDAYKIWLSEIILQQTRVEQGLRYYENFVKTFPTIHHLARASEQKVLKLLEGLGYYSRCRNLIYTAKYISYQLNGDFPATYDTIKALKGVGSYTAAAIASFAYNLPYAVLDGNVFRVLSRIYNIPVAIDTAEGKSLFFSLAQKHLPAHSSAVYNQAIMDFGATICKPAPECAACFFSRRCKSFLKDTKRDLPVKSKTVVVRERWLNYIILKCNKQIAIHQRCGTDIWKQLHEFCLVETKSQVREEYILQQLQNKFQFQAKHYKVARSLPNLSQRLSHQFIHFSFLVVELKRATLINDFFWVPRSELLKYPFPRTLQQMAKRLRWQKI